MEEYKFKIRAHHGMCLAFFQGKGYSDGFAEHMTWVKEQLSENPVVCIADTSDDICSACPNLQENICIDSEKVVRYDRMVLHACGLEPGKLLPFSEFEKLVWERILLPGNREQICGDCMWSELCQLSPLKTAP